VSGTTNIDSVAEAELLRAVAASMSCPMPPILPDGSS
jgi:hypothetical protein